MELVLTDVKYCVKGRRVHWNFSKKVRKLAGNTVTPCTLNSLTAAIIYGDKPCAATTHKLHYISGLQKLKDVSLKNKRINSMGNRWGEKLLKRLSIKSRTWVQSPPQHKIRWAGWHSCNASPGRGRQVDTGNFLMRQCTLFSQFSVHPESTTQKHWCSKTKEWYSGLSSDLHRREHVCVSSSHTRDKH